MTGVPAAPTRSRVGLWRDIATVLVEFARAHPLAFGVLILLHVSNARAGIYLAAMSAIIDGIVRASLGQPPVGPPLLFWFALWAGTTVFERIYWFSEPILSTYLGDHGLHRITRRIVLRSSAAPLIDFEVGDFFDRLQRASEGHGWRLLDVFRRLLNLARTVVAVGSIVVTLGVIHPLLLPLLIAGSVPSLWLQARVASAVYLAQRAHTTGDRLRSHIQSLLTGQAAAGEVRLFGSAPYLVNRWRELRLGRRRDVLGAERRRAKRIAIGDTLSGGAYAGALVVVTWLILGGELSIGAYVAVATGALWFQEMLGGSIGSIRSLEEQSQFLGDLFDFLRTVKAEPEVPAAATTPPPTATSRGTPAPIALNATGVAFTFPGRDTPVLRDIDLHIAPGERIAIVGENGAGKTTLAKLLVGLYQPTSGAILLDGEPLTTARAVAVRGRIAAVFQDFARFQLTARENIGFGDVTRLQDGAAIAAAAERAGIADLIESLPEKYESYLGRQFGETDLSGGQWQRVALARAFFRDADFLLLDEPTAALDPLAELALFERFAELTQGRTAVMISHRLGAARLADRVIVIKDGRIVEVGHHDELVGAGGEYARLFAAQAQWYRPAAAAEGAEAAAGSS